MYQLLCLSLLHIRPDPHHVVWAQPQNMRADDFSGRSSASKRYMYVHRGLALCLSGWLGQPSQGSWSSSQTCWTSPLFIPTAMHHAMLL